MCCIVALAPHLVMSLLQTWMMTQSSAQVSIDAVIECHVGPLVLLIWCLIRFMPRGNRTSLPSRCQIAWLRSLGKSLGKSSSSSSESKNILNSLAQTESILLAATNRLSCELWNLRRPLSLSGRTSLTGHKKPVLCASFVKDWTSVVSGSRDAWLRLWDIQESTC